MRVAADSTCPIRYKAIISANVVNADDNPQSSNRHRILAPEESGALAVVQSHALARRMCSIPKPRPSAARSLCWWRLTPSDWCEIVADQQASLIVYPSKSSPEFLEEKSWARFGLCICLCPPQSAASPNVMRVLPPSARAENLRSRSGAPSRPGRTNCTWPLAFRSKTHLCSKETQAVCAALHFSSRGKTTPRRRCD